MVMRHQTQSRVASRGTLRELNSKPYWSEGKQVDVMAGETATDVEFAENYGSTSVPAKQDKDENPQPQQQQGSGNDGAGGSKGTQGQQPKGDAPEVIMLYLNGHSSHPVIISCGDRRHRLLELEEGDVAQHRLKDDRQQMLYSKDGTYISTRSDKVMRIALVPQDDQAQQQQPQQPQATQTAAGGNGGAGGNGASGQQQKKKSYGQKSAKDDNKKSSVAIEQNGKDTTSTHGDALSRQRGGSDSTVFFANNSCQSTDAHSHILGGGVHIWVAGGCFSDMPIIVKRDGLCKDR